MTSPESYFSPDQVDFIRFLVQGDVDFMIVGGTAVAFHGYPRNTKDLDIFVSGTEQNVKKLFASIDAFFEDVHPDIGHYDDFVGSDKVLRFGQGRSRTDLLFGIDGILFGDAEENCETLKLDDIQIPIIGYEELIANKVTAGREQDQADVDQLRRIKNQDQNE